MDYVLLDLSLVPGEYPWDIFGINGAVLTAFSILQKGVKYQLTDKFSWGQPGRITLPGMVFPGDYPIYLDVSAGVPGLQQQGGGPIIGVLHLEYQYSDNQCGLQP